MSEDGEGGTRLDAVGLAARIRDGELTPREAVEEAINRIEAVNPGLNAVIHTRFEAALREVDRGLPEGPLRGVPTLVKDLGADVAGEPTTRGSKLFHDARAEKDSELVARYRRAGMVVMGTTNSPELGKNASTEPVVYGPTRNPWLTTHSPGGSSGGSAAAVASGMVPVAHGNDGGGSIRIPSSMCGLFGLKPSRARVPNAPHSGPVSNPLSTNHALTTTVRDSATLLDIGAGPMPGDPCVAPHQARQFLQETRTSPGMLRIACTATTANGTLSDPECSRAAERAAAICGDLGHEVTEASLRYDAAAAGKASSVLMEANLAFTVDRRLAELGRELRDDDLEPFTHAMLERARSLRGGEVIGALDTAHAVGCDVARSLSGYDLLLTPTVPVPPPELGTLDTTQPELMFSRAAIFMAFTGVFNLTGQPAMSVPFGTTATGLPVGVQFAAPLGGEAMLLRLAAQLEQAAPWQVGAVVPASLP